LKNREIKFRIWTGSEMEYKVMVGFLGAFYVKGIDEKDTACMSGFNTKYPESCVPMQFTGLKDNAGKEIYEGDILKTHDEVVSVFYNESTACFDIQFAGGDCDNLYTQDFEEHMPVIIGNIHENPELGGISI